MVLSGPLLWRIGGAERGREIESSVPSNSSLGTLERAEEVAGDRALSAELIDIKGRRCYAILGGIIIMALIVLFDSKEIQIL